MGRPSSGGIGQDQGRTLLSTHLILLWSWSSYDYHPAVWCESGGTRSLATTSRRHRQWENCGHGIKVTHRRRVSIFQYWKRMPGSNVQPWEIRVLSTREAYLEWDWPPTTWTDLQKNIAEAPALLQILLLRCLKFDIEANYRRGENIPIADALSRVCLKKKEHTPVSNKSKWCSPDSNIHFITEESCPMSIDLVTSTLARDKSMHVLKQIIYNGWPSQRNECPKELWEYWNHRCELTLEDGVILKSDRVVLPESLRGQVLDLIHSCHQGETKCLLLARQSVFWPGISRDIREMVKACEACNKYQQAQQ